MGDTDMGQKKSILDVVVSVAVIASSLAVVALAAQRFVQSRPSPRGELAVPTEPLALGGAPVVGNASAKVGLVVFSDFECPFCARFATDVIPVLKSEYVGPGNVRLYFRHLPLPIHRFAKPAAVAAECAARQGRFWELHDWLFADRANLGGNSINSRIVELGLDGTMFSDCLSDGTGDARISLDMGAATALRIRSTPTVFIGVIQSDSTLLVRHAISGARSAGEFRIALDATLAGAGQ